MAIKAGELSRLQTAMRVAEEGFDPFTEMPYDQLLGYLDQLFEDDERANISGRLSLIDDPHKRRTVVNAAIFSRLVDRGIETEVTFQEIVAES